MNEFRGRLEKLSAVSAAIDLNLHQWLKSSVIMCGKTLKGFDSGSGQFSLNLDTLTLEARTLDNVPCMIHLSMQAVCTRERFISMNVPVSIEFKQDALNKVFFNGHEYTYEERPDACIELRVHFDIDSVEDPRNRHPIPCHVQWGGNPGELRNRTKLAKAYVHRLDEPRLPIPPHDVFLVMDLVSGQFQSDALRGLVSTEIWRYCVDFSEQSLMLPWQSLLADRLRAKPSLSAPDQKPSHRLMDSSDLGILPYRTN